MVSSHKIPTITILCIFIGTIQQVGFLGRGREKTKKATENDIESKACSQKSDVPDTNLSLYFFLKLNLSFLVFHEALVIL